MFSFFDHIYSLFSSDAVDNKHLNYDGSIIFPFLFEFALGQVGKYFFVLFVRLFCNRNAIRNLYLSCFKCAIFIIYFCRLLLASSKHRLDDCEFLIIYLLKAVFQLEN